MNYLVKGFYNWYRGTMKHPQYRWLVIIGTLIYLLSPLDISPDVIPIVGWIDDGLLISLLITEITDLFREYGQQKSDQSTSEENSTHQTTIDVEVIE
ncbi:MAG TPA: hypothetical protein DCF68_07600 [Cyanothece sp. UBA12306]|nr:hypothetical protein [Cyanothece sp. UBA12306]